MEGFLKVSTAVDVTITMVDTGSATQDGKTGLTLTIYASKAAGSFALITPTVTELDSTNAKGVYKLALTTTHTNTLGELILHITGSGAYVADYKWQVSTYLPGEAAILHTDYDAAKTAATQSSVNTIDGIVDDILVDTAVIGATGGGLTSLATQASVDDLPTNAELAASQAAADDATLAAIATAQTSINDLPTNSELAIALAGADDAVLTAIGDLPTNAELATALGTADDAVLAQVALVKAVTDKVDVMIEDADVQGYRYTVTALENAPSGGGGGSAADVWAYEIEGNTAGELLDRAGSKPGQ